MRNFYYKIIRGYSAEDYIEITEEELEKACYCFLMKKDSIYSGGAVKGSEILAIQPDYHRTMGWNRGYKLQVGDFRELNQTGVDRKMQIVIEKVKDKVQYLLKNNKEDLIGKGFNIQELEKPKEMPKEIQGRLKDINNKFKIE
jgi:hypothetical protein